MRDRGYFEKEAERVYRAARLSPRDSSPAILTRALLGQGAVVVVAPEILPTGGAIVRAGDRWRILLREGAAPEQARFTVLHELSHWLLGNGATEEECDALGACLLAPRILFDAAIRQVGHSYRQLARYFGCTETFAALRYGEVTGEPLVVVAPANVRIRGRAWSWPAEPELRRLAKAPRPKGLQKVRLRDAPLRAVLRVG